MNAAPLISGLLAALLCVAAAAPVARAQGADSSALRRGAAPRPTLPAAGAKVRVLVRGEAPCCAAVERWHRGSFLRVRGDSLWVRRSLSVDTLVVPAERVLRLERHRGGSSRGEGFLKGAGAGAVVIGGLMLLANANAQDDGIGTFVLSRYGVPIFVLGGGALGAALAGERWAIIPWPPPETGAP